MKNYSIFSFILSFILASFGFLTSGCATSSLSVKNHDLATQSWSGTAILLDYDLIHVAHQNDCTLVLSSAGSSAGQNYEITLPVKSHQVLIDLPAGSYVGKSISCERLQSWELGSSFLKGQFKIVSGKINYLGKVIFQLNEDRSALTVRMADPEDLVNSVHSDFEHFPSAWIQSLFNPFTSRPIDSQAIVHPSSYEIHIHTSYLLKPGEKSGPSTKGLEASIDECEIQETHVYPYRLGTLTYTATYEGQKLLDLKKEEHHSFSDVFTSCIEQSFSNFVPADDTRIKVVVSI